MINHWRSLLFAAADDHTRLAKITEHGADAVILDLEDAVPADRKAAARAGLPSVVSALAQRSCSLVVRINTPWREAMDDLAVAVRRGVSAIMVPKVEEAARVAVMSEMIIELASTVGPLEPPGLIALVESPAGLASLDAIAGVKGVIGLALGSEDFSLALGVPPASEALNLPCRLLALSAARRGLMALGAPASICIFDDQAAWLLAVRKARAIGLTGVLCIHPRQIAPVNEAFAFSPMEVAAAARIIAAWEAAGSAGVIQVDGMMVDRPVVMASRRTLAIAESMKRSFVNREK
jgi:citrate lyase subunit beta/citryl-CoA lyase